MGNTCRSGWHHLYMGNTNTDSYIYVCNGAQYSSTSGSDGNVNHRYWFRTHTN